MRPARVTGSTVAKKKIENHFIRNSKEFKFLCFSNSLDLSEFFISILLAVSSVFAFPCFSSVRDKFSS